jgi:hypothetical protein
MSMLSRLENILGRKHTLVFVISSPRSGSTWLKQALNVHPEIHCTENRLFGPHFDVVLDGPLKVPRLRITLDAYVDSLLKSVTRDGLALDGAALRNRIVRELAISLMRVEYGLSRRRILVDKFTPYVGTAKQAIALLQELFPAAKLVHLVRDGRDVVTSGVFHWLNKTLDGQRECDVARARRTIFTEGISGPSLDRFFTEPELDEWARTWSEPNRTMMDVAGTQRVHRIRYEDMLQDHGQELQRLFEFISAAADDVTIGRCIAASAFERMSGGRTRGQMDPTAHVRSGVAGDWKTYFRRVDAQQFHKLAGRELIELGYETSDAWVHSAPETLRLTARRIAS